MDYSIGSATGMMNLNTLNWDKDVLNLLEISETQLPELVSTTHIMKQVKRIMPILWA